ncbi:hypothetical protein [Alicyclobacillus mengziensis]|uniref:Uncharacterized protein n=1 Tax=Alicyclobacillus mengziensis TaxID=2931921 RepID=A0A9X7Z8I1_9BACL|nr:hypothetical protein [Alicyclobacillus mengziensis]QSO48348.1 hypothetical protein JZ786_05000 [Alicyclobacillus mengziensis]
MTGDQKQSVDDIRVQVRQEVAMQMFNFLPVPTIAKVCNLTVKQRW